MSKLYQNKWAGYEMYFVPLHPVRTCKGEAISVGGYEIICIDGVWKCKKGRYYTQSLRDEEHFPVVGDVKIDILGYVKDTMLAEVKSFKGEKDGE